MWFTSPVPSTFTWLDTTTREQRRALEVIDLFALRDTVDQLGIGSVRDAWAERLSPGTSTIQTRARYFFFVPWIYEAVRRDSRRSGGAGARARRYELRLVDAILAADEGGVPIGARVGRGLKQLPSTIYWAGLGRYGIRLWQGSQAAFHRALPGLGPEAWHPHLPAAPEGFLDCSALALERSEAEFFREQIRAHAPGSLLQFLMDVDTGEANVQFPWEHPLRGRFGSELERWVHHAEAFALHMHGAALLYNRMLAERLGPSSHLEPEECVERYGRELVRWSDDVATWRGAGSSWDRREFWRLTQVINPRVPPQTRAFCEAWLERVLGAQSPLDLMDEGFARQLVERREVRLKGHRSRLRNREQLERWGGRSGAGRLDYRWGITQRLVRDVQEGLGRG
ncbi:DUF6361 family protein [Planctomycetota bacterium]|jgi:hypothetical protein|nr:DUF6361 family protein [Planctomycetota bacterium]